MFQPEKGGQIGDDAQGENAPETSVVDFDESAEAVESDAEASEDNVYSRDEANELITQGYWESFLTLETQLVEGGLMTQREFNMKLHMCYSQIIGDVLDEAMNIKLQTAALREIFGEDNVDLEHADADIKRLAQLALELDEKRHQVNDSLASISRDIEFEIKLSQLSGEIEDKS